MSLSEKSPPDAKRTPLLTGSNSDVVCPYRKCMVGLVHHHLHLLPSPHTVLPSPLSLSSPSTCRNSVPDSDGEQKQLMNDIKGGRRWEMFPG